MLPSAAILINTFCLLEIAYAITWSGPKATPAGLMAIKGVSPRPTQAPGWDGIPRELRKRAGQYLYPPPPEWCGFVEGDYDNVLSCNTGYTCTNSGAAFGCCTGPAGQCENIFTSCVDSAYPALCDADCTLDPQVLKCTESSIPWCGTYSFYGGTYLYNCEYTFGLSSVESLADWYGALGSTLTSTEEESTAISTRQSRSTTESSLPRRSSSSTSTGSSLPEATSSTPIIIASSVLPAAHRILSGAAIGGIAVGGAIVLIAIVAGIVFACCYRRRRQRREQQQQQQQYQYAAVAQAPMPRPPATFDPTQDYLQQGIGGQQQQQQHENKYSAFKPSYLNPPSPLPHQAGWPPSSIQPYDPSREFSQAASTVSTVVSPQPLHFDEMPKKGPSPEERVGYFSPPTSTGFSELSEGDGLLAQDHHPNAGLPTQLRVGSPRSQVYSSVHEVPTATTTTPEPERWELPSRP